MAHFALNQAAYCPSCDTVGDDLTRCACCRATSLLVLATVLNRTDPPQPAADAQGRESQLRRRESSAIPVQALLPTRD